MKSDPNCGYAVTVWRLCLDLALWAEFPQSEKYANLSTGNPKISFNFTSLLILHKKPLVPTCHE